MYHVLRVSFSKAASGNTFVNLWKARNGHNVSFKYLGKKADVKSRVHAVAQRVFHDPRNELAPDEIKAVADYCM